MQRLSEHKLPRNFRGRSALFVQLWWFIQAFFFKSSPQVLYGWRRFLLRCFGARIGRGVLIRPSVTVTYPWKVSIGDYCWIGDDVVLYSLGNIEIGDNSVVSQKCYLCTGSHNYKKESFDIFSKDIIIGSECWLATDVFVGPGVSVGSGAVVGARSSVYKSIAGQFIYAGNPAAVMSKRND